MGACSTNFFDEKHAAHFCVIPAQLSRYDHCKEYDTKRQRGTYCTILYVSVVRVTRKCSRTGVPLADTVSAGVTKRHFSTPGMMQKDLVSSYYCTRYHAKMRGRINVLPVGENRMIVPSFVSTKHRNVTEDRRTDGRTASWHIQR